MGPIKIKGNRNYCTRAIYQEHEIIQNNFEPNYRIWKDILKIWM